MTIATRNGALIVKDGKLAESCGCCGGWYCCFSPACVVDSISSVSVTISAQDYLIWQRALFSGNNNFYSSIGFLGSSYNGTHSLTKQSDGSTWKKLFTPTPHATCLGDLTFSAGPGGWSLTFRYSILVYGDFDTETYKELSQMECRGFPDRAAGYPMSSGPQGSESLSGNVDQCGSLTGVMSRSFQAVFPPLPYSGSNGSRVAIREEGSYMVTFGASVS